ncbi:MAG: YbaK/EbsC family protein, partial [Actinobacteria bacterium]|nr:YbaK/EbsC family protein [Actinomycetota bacterium]
MNGVLEKSAVKRVVAAKKKFGISGEIKVLTETAKSAVEAAAGLGIEVGQIASSIIF